MTHYTPNLPALIGALPGDHTRAPQTEFTRARQVLFLDNLSVTGSVRSAAAAAGGVSHQTAYRARRGQAHFRLAWDAAMLAARANAEATLAARAIDGVTEEVRYHGEVVGTRTRYCSRLLLAHLARLDRLAEKPDAAAFAEDWEDELGRFERGEAVLAADIGEPPTEVPACAGTQHRSPAEGGAGGHAQGEESSFGPCNTRSMSYTADEEDWDDDEPDDGIDWEDEEAADAEIARIEAAMAADRPADAPRLTGEGPDGEDRDPGGLIADAQWQAFEQGVPRWWLVVPPVPHGGEGGWHHAEAAPGGAGTR